MFTAQEIRFGDRAFTIIGACMDAFWVHRRRKFYIGPPRTLSTVGVYAFWAGTWYCASNSGDWTHAAIARDRDRIRAASVPLHAHTGGGSALAPATGTKDVPLARQTDHLSAYSGLATWPGFIRLFYAYRPLFWLKSFPFKFMWMAGTAYTGFATFGWLVLVSRSQQQLEVWETGTRKLEGGKTG